MRVPFNYLMDILEKTASIGIVPPQNGNSPISRPKFLLPDTVLEAGRLYIADPAIVQKDRIPATSALLTSPAPAQLLNQLQEIFDRCETWEGTLSAAAATGDLRELLDEIEAILGNPIVLRKSNYAIVACSSEVFSNPALADLRGTHLPYEYVNSLKRDVKFEQMRTSETPFFFSVPVSKSQALGVNLFPEAGATYCLSAIPLLRPLTHSDCFPLEICAGHVTQVLRSTVIAGRYADPSGRRERLMELFRTSVENKSADVIVLEQGFSSLGCQPNHQYCCLSLRTGSPDYLSYTEDLLCNQVESLLPEACVFASLGTIAVLLNLTLAGAEIRELLEKCVYFFRDNDLRTGVSNVFTGFRELRNYHRQSLIALDFASRPQAFLWIRYFSDVVLDYILEQSNRELPLHLICSQQILQLKQYDQEHQTEFYVTLESYIQNKFNAVQTARELQIHRSTFLYRMERLQTLFGLDLDQRDSLLYILLSMKMLELSKSMMLHE